MSHPNNSSCPCANDRLYITGVHSIRLCGNICNALSTGTSSLIFRKFRMVHRVNLSTCTTSSFAFRTSKRYTLSAKSRINFFSI